MVDIQEAGLDYRLAVSWSTVTSPLSHPPVTFEASMGQPEGSLGSAVQGMSGTTIFTSPRTFGGTAVEELHQVCMPPDGPRREGLCYYCVDCNEPGLTIVDFLTGSHLHHQGVQIEDALLFIPASLLHSLREQQKQHHEQAEAVKAKEPPAEARLQRRIRRENLSLQELEEWRARVDRAIQQKKQQIRNWERQYTQQQRRHQQASLVTDWAYLSSLHHLVLAVIQLQYFNAKRVLLQGIFQTLPTAATAAASSGSFNNTVPNPLHGWTDGASMLPLYDYQQHLRQHWTTASDFETLLGEVEVESKQVQAAIKASSLALSVHTPMELSHRYSGSRSRSSSSESSGSCSSSSTSSIPSQPCSPAFLVRHGKKKKVSSHSELVPSARHPHQHQQQHHHSSNLPVQRFSTPSFQTLTLSHRSGDPQRRSLSDSLQSTPLSERHAGPHYRRRQQRSQSGRTLSHTHGSKPSSSNLPNSFSKDDVNLRSGTWRGEIDMMTTSRSHHFIENGGHRRKSDLHALVDKYEEQLEEDLKELRLALRKREEKEKHELEKFLAHRQQSWSEQPPSSSSSSNSHSHSARSSKLKMASQQRESSHSKRLSHASTNRRPTPRHQLLPDRLSQSVDDRAGLVLLATSASDESTSGDGDVYEDDDSPTRYQGGQHSFGVGLRLAQRRAFLWGLAHPAPTRRYGHEGGHKVRKQKALDPTHVMLEEPPHFQQPSSTLSHHRRKGEREKLPTQPGPSWNTEECERRASLTRRLGRPSRERPNGRQSPLSPVISPPVPPPPQSLEVVPLKSAPTKTAPPAPVSKASPLPVAATRGGGEKPWEAKRNPGEEAAPSCTSTFSDSRNISLMKSSQSPQPSQVSSTAVETSREAAEPASYRDVPEDQKAGGPAFVRSLQKPIPRNEVET